MKVTTISTNLNIIRAGMTLVDARMPARVIAKKLYLPVINKLYNQISGLKN